MIKPVVVVGAGLAGLTCARKLHQSGVPVIVVDADDRPGGKLKTDRIGGFSLDRGFQVLLSAYPYARRELDLEALNLGKFKKGAYIHHGDGLHLLEPQSFMEMFRTKFEVLKDKTIPKSDKKLLAKFADSVGQLSPRQAYASSPRTGLDFLEHFGFGDEIIDRFFRPFFGGIFLDNDLQVDSRQLQFVWTMICQGDTCIPAEGIQAITDQIAHDIPRYLFRLGNPVKELIKNDRGRPVGVRLDTSEEVIGNTVVLATDAAQAAHIAGQPTVEGGRASTCLYFETASPIVDGGYLVLNGSGEGLVNHVAPVSNVSPTLAPAGKHLASVTVLGNPNQSDDELAETVKNELNTWAPDKGTYMWRFIKAYRIQNAQMLQSVGFSERLPNNATHTDGLYWAGEFTTNSSIDGAIRSGLECASLVLSEREESEAA